MLQIIWHVALIEFKDQLKFRYQVRLLWFISAIATTVELLDIAVPIMHFAAYLEIIIAG
jgi:hypothetical protein